jgi:hypothetical protein
VIASTVEEDCYLRRLAMAQQTIDAPSKRSADRPAQRPGRRARASGLIRSYPWIIVALVLLGLSTVLVLWAKTRPGYDPYGWMVWGYQTLHLSLDLGGAPSWKPLPYVFDVPYALFGHYQLWLWMITSVWISLSGTIFAGRIAYRLTVREAPDAERWPAIAAAVFAGAGLLGLQAYMHYVLSVQSDTMITTLFLAAIDAHLSGHPRLAFVVGCVAGLGRPEVWSTLAPYTLWLWFTRPAMRRLLAAGWVVILFFWFGVPAITNNRPFLAEQLALKSPRELHQNKVIGTIHRFTGLTWLPVQLASLLALVVAWRRRNWTVLLLGLSAVTWVLVEIVLVLRGLPGVPRYLFEPAAVETALAGTALGGMLLAARRASARRLVRIGGVVLAVALVGPMIPAAVARLRDERLDLRHERGRTTVINRLQATINALGGYKRIRYCGHPVTNVEYVSILAWYTKLNVGKVGYLPKRELKKPYPIVLFVELPNGWETQTYHQKGALRSACASLNAAWIYTGPHPHGVLVPRS